jgi:hypothetical protein
MLRDIPLNSTAITIKKILDGKLKCDTYNLRICFYDYVVKDKANLEVSLKELEEKGLYDSEIFKEYISDFEAKIEIYNQYLKLLAEREISAS